MSPASTPESQAKISASFAERLARLDPREIVQAIVLPTALAAQAGPRRERIEAVRREGEAHFSEIDDLLQRCGGQRLTEQPNTLGAITVETTRIGVYTIAELTWVAAVIENQSIRGLSPGRG